MKDSNERVKKSKEWISACQDVWVQDLKELIKIPSISQSLNCESAYPFGEECARALKKTLAIAKRMGFETECCEFYYGTAFLPGKNPNCGEIGIFLHLDVVPPGEGWKYPPFSALQEGDLIIGRGSRDNKGAVVAALYAVKALVENGIVLQHGIRFFFGCNEELGMEDVSYYLKDHSCPVFSIVPDSPFPVCYGEKGVIEVEIKKHRIVSNSQIITFDGGTASNQIPACAEMQVKPQEMKHFHNKDGITIYQKQGWTHIVSYGRAAHSAYPEGSENGIIKLLNYILETDILSREEWEQMALVCRIFGGWYGKELGIDCEDSATGKLTCVLTRMSVHGNEWKGSVNIRYPVTAVGTEICKKLEKVFSQYGFEIIEMKDNPGYILDSSHQIVDLLNHIVCKNLDISLEPYTAKGGTYARKIPGPAVGYGPNCSEPHPFGKGRGTGHLPDEAVSIVGLQKAAEIYAEAIVSLDTALCKKEE